MIQSPTDARTAQSEPHAAPQTDPTNPVRALQTFGQSVWLDYLRRSLFTSGEFKRLIDEDGLRGVTSNPSIFEKAIAGSTDYLNALQDIERRGDLEPMAVRPTKAVRTAVSSFRSPATMAGTPRCRVRRYSFGVVKAAEARGDSAVLVERERRALRVHIGADVTAGLKVLGAAVARAVEQRHDDE